jgi:hypothetical protein
MHATDAARSEDGDADTMDDRHSARNGESTSELAYTGVYDEKFVELA